MTELRANQWQSTHRYMTESHAILTMLTTLSSARATRLSTMARVWPSQLTRDVQPMLVQCWPIVFDACPTLLRHWLNVSCLLGASVGYIAPAIITNIATIVRC